MRNEFACVIVSEIVGCSLNGLDCTTSVDAIEGWDSLAHMNIILELERRIARELTPKEILSIRTVGDVSRLLDVASQA